jgi:hypothetical protein
MDFSTVLRYFGNLFLIVGYYIILWGDMKVGLFVKTVGGLLLIPSFVFLKMWDALILCGFFAVIEISKLISLIK